MNHLDPTAVLARFGPITQGARIEFLGQAGGLSGALFWRIDSPLGALCLRRWPREHPSRERLTFIHAVLAHAVKSGIDYVPAPLATVDGETMVGHAGHWWELSPWLPGTSDFEKQPRERRLAAAMAALARYHLAVARFSTNALPHGKAPGIADRIEQMRSLAQPGSTRPAEAAVADDGPELAERARRILTTYPATLPRVWRALHEAAELDVALAPCLRDVWYENVLFTGDVVTGIVDFGAMRVDNVATDIARLLGSMAADEVEKWRAGLVAYSSVRPLSPCECKLIAAFDASGVLLGSLNWVHWLLVERRRFDDRPRVLCRLDHLSGRLARLAQLDEPTAVALAVQSLQWPEGS